MRAALPRVLAAVATATLALALVAVAPRAAAIDRPLALLLGDMMPAGGSRDCLRFVTSELRSREHSPIEVTRMGARSVRRLAHHEDDETSFLDWSVDDVRLLLPRRGDRPLDAVALLDCRADEAHAEMLLLSPAGGLGRIVLRDTTIDEERAHWLGRTLRFHVMIGFDP